MDGALMRRGAEFDETGAYRYRLWRAWNTSLSAVTFLMLNPSTADQERDDPTIRQCIGLARAWGYGSLEVVNLFAYRATSPGALKQAADPVGEANDRYILECNSRSERIVLAWGNHGGFGDRARQVLTLVSTHESLCCLGLTLSGEPRHPLYVPGGVLPRPWVSTLLKP